MLSRFYWSNMWASWHNKDDRNIYKYITVFHHIYMLLFIKVSITIKAQSSHPEYLSPLMTCTVSYPSYLSEFLISTQNWASRSPSQLAWNRTCSSPTLRVSCIYYSFSDLVLKWPSSSLVPPSSWLTTTGSGSNSTPEILQEIKVRTANILQEIKVIITFSLPFS